MRKGNFLKLLKLGFTKRSLSCPVYLNLFITEKCNFRCKHCFIDWESTQDRKNNLSIDEIKRLSNNLNSLHSVTLTGGEPILREDIGEIAEIFINRNRTPNLFIPTNGWYSDRAEKAIDYICRKAPDSNIGVSLSIDGPREIHNEIRGNPESFDRCLETAGRLELLSNKYENLALGFNITLSEFNFSHYPDVYNFLNQKFPDLDCSFNLCRDEPDREHGFVLPKTSGLDNFFAELNHRSVSDCKYSLSAFPGNAWRIYLSNKTLDIIKNQHQAIPCHVGQIYSVIYANGDVSFCESLPPIGNIRHAENFREIWHGAKAKNMREHIKNKKCYCHHECFQPLNIALSPTCYPGMTLSYLKYLLSSLLPKLDLAHK